MFNIPHLCYMYLITSPWWLRALYPVFTWRMPGDEKVIYLTFDDGPHPQATPFVLEQLKKFDAKASFFCIGKNVVAEPGIYRQVLAEGHAVGNHTYHHYNGWKTEDAVYMEDIQKTMELVPSKLFRPPYGRIKRSQAKQLLSPQLSLRTIMWDVLSGDFDTRLQPQACFNNVIKHTRPGSIIVFHDSQKALPRMQYALPRVLEYFSERGYRFERMDMG